MGQCFRALQHCAHTHTCPQGLSRWLYPRVSTKKSHDISDGVSTDVSRAIGVGGFEFVDLEIPLIAGGLYRH